MRTDEIMREAGLQIAIARLDFSPAEIADLTGVPLPELEKYFRAELANPVEILNARVLFALQRQIERGSVAGIRLWLKYIEPRQPPSAEPRRQVLGRKPTRDLDHSEVPTAWRKLLPH